MCNKLGYDLKHKKQLAKLGLKSRIDMNGEFYPCDDVVNFFSKTKLGEIDDLKKENKELSAKLFNEQQHYEVLKENYDDAFKFLEHKCGATFESFVAWQTERMN